MAKQSKRLALVLLGAVACILSCASDKPTTPQSNEPPPPAVYDQFIIQTNLNACGAFATAYLLWNLQYAGKTFAGVPEHEKVTVNNVAKLEALNASSDAQTYVDTTLYAAAKFDDAMATSISNALYAASSGSVELDLSDASDPIKIMEYLDTLGIEGVFYTGEDPNFVALINAYKTVAPPAVAAFENEGRIQNETISLAVGQYAIVPCTDSNAESLHYLLLHRKSSETTNVYTPWTGHGQRFTIDPDGDVYIQIYINTASTPWSLHNPSKEEWKRYLGAGILIPM